MQAISFRPSRANRSIAGWIRHTAEAGVPVTRDQMEAWALGLDQSASRYAELESRLEQAEIRPEAYVSTEAAEAIFDAAQVRLTRLAVLAQDAATYAELKQIDQDASFLIDALESLTRGVIRPAGDPSETETPEPKGA